MPRGRKEISSVHFEHGRLLLRLWFVFAAVLACSGEKTYRYASLTECDRHSLDAIYHEKFKIITDNVFKDVIEFVRRVSDSISDSLTNIMAQLPDRTASDSQEQKIFAQFKSVKSSFTSRAGKLSSRILAAWESLSVTHMDLMVDRENASLPLYVQKTSHMADSYSESRKTLDALLESFVTFIKSTVRDGLQGITSAAANALKKDAKKNDTAKGEREDKEEKVEEEEETEQERLWKKQLEIAEMVVQGFLGRVTTEVIRRKTDLFAKVELTADQRESVLDDLEFDILMIKNRILAISQLDDKNDKASVDLARRSIFTYWADRADDMYKEKIQSKKSTAPGGPEYYKNLWGDEQVLMNTLLSLMEVYP